MFFQEKSTLNCNDYHNSKHILKTKTVGVWLNYFIVHVNSESDYYLFIYFSSSKALLNKKNH
jgi:hypothetical protein